MSASFDSGTDSWTKRGTETVTQTTAAAQSGAGSLLATGRTSSWNGPGVNASALQPGATYDFSIYAKLKEDAVGSANVELTINQQGLPKTDKGADDPATYAKIAAKAVSAADWVQLKGQLTVDSRATGYQVYVQATDSATVSYYIDTFEVKLVALPTTPPPQVTKVPVVLYHKVNVTAEANNDYQTTVDIFKQQMKYLADNGYTTLSAQQYYDIISGNAVAPDRPILLTFDDGTPDFYNNAYPVLKQYGMKAVAFIVSDWIGGGYSMSKTQLEALANDPNIDLQNHTKTHKDLTKLTQSEAEAEIAATNTYLKGITGKDAWMLAYPNGAFNATVAQTAANQGIKLAFKVGSGITTPSSDKFGLGREMVLVTDTLATFATKIQGPTPTQPAATDMKADFEDGQGAWVRRNGDGNISVTQADNHTPGGSKSLLTTVSQQYDGPLLDVLGKMEKGHKYSLSAWVKLAPGQTPTTLRISVQSGDSTFANVSQNAKVTPDNWVQLTGTFTLTTAPTILKAYVEAADSLSDARSFYTDDFVLAHVGVVEGPKPIQTDIDHLKDVYADYFKIGAAVEPAQLEGEVHTLLDYHYNSIVAENSMKPGSLNPSEGVWNWTSADKIAKYAKDHNLTLRLHTLAWHSQAAEWMFQDAGKKPLAATPENKELVLNRLTTYIQTVTRHFKDMGVKIDAVDVVNEVIDEGQPDGMRKSEWFRLTGTDFIKTAFIVARQELPNAMLYINDYNTQDPKKRDFLYDLVTKLKAEGVPIDGVGHQTHINISGPSIQQISDSIRKFGEAGFDNQLTELDVSVYTNNSTSYDTIPADILVKQGYRFKELFKALVQLDSEGITVNHPEGWISNVTIWGIADDHTWLHNRGTTRQDAPFPFDKQYQAKYAYWGMVEAVKPLNPSHLPMTPKQSNTAQGTVSDSSKLAWNSVPAIKTDQLGTLSAEVKTLWDAQNLYVRVAVQDATVTATDQVELFVDSGTIRKLTFPRNDAAVKEATGGYVVETSIPLAGSLGKQVKFDVRVTDKGINDGSEQGGNGVIVSWSDPRNAQESDSQGYGVLTYIEATRTGTAVYGTPAIDAELDDAWKKATVYHTEVKVEQAGNASATAEFRTMWDENKLYVYAIVTDSVLSDKITNEWEQDSIEVFVDQNNGKTTSYQTDDGQYRINFKNVRTVGGHASGTNYTSATKEVSGGYVVEVAINLDTITPAAGTLIGFDLQVNNDQDGGTRDSVFIWNDPTGQSYANTSRFGVMELAGAEDPGTDPGTGTNPGTGSGIVTGGNGNTEQKDPANKITVDVDGNGKATASVDKAAFEEALKNVKAGRIEFEIKAPSSATSIAAKLPVSQLQAAADAGANRVRIDMGVAKLELPSSLFTGSSNAAEAELVLSAVDTADLPQSVRDTVAGNPVFDFNLFVGGQRIGQFGAGQEVKVSIPYKLKQGENPEQVVVYFISDNGELEVVTNGHYNASSGSVEFKAAHFSQYAAVWVPVKFSDLDLTAWAKSDIQALAARGIVNGVSADSFAPKKDVTRAEFAKMLVQALKLQAGEASNPFSDVQEGQWYYEAVVTAYALGIVKGNTDGTFGVQDKISRQDMAVMTYRALSAAGLSVTSASAAPAFKDASAIAAYAQEAVSAMQQAGIINGMADGTFAPAATANRAQAAVILNQLLGRM